MAVGAGSIYSEVRVLLDKLKGDVKAVDAEFDKIELSSKESSGKTSKSWQDSFNKINIAGVAAFAAITIAVKKAIDVFGDFEQSMANTQSVARGTPIEFEKLESAALAAGEATRFTASQAADALYYLASAGLSATESVEALGGVLELAGATGSDLAFTSATMTAALSQFDIAAKDSGRVANVFAAAIAGSQANMEKLATSLKYVGPVAAGFNMSIEETIGILEGLYNAGYQGEQAGAALRNILADLSNVTGPVVGKIQELGIAFEDITPETNSFADIVQTLNERGLTTADTMSIFGNRAGPIMATLLKNGADSIREYTKEITGTNAAAEAYAIQNDTLKGSIDKLKSATESAAIKTVEEFAPAIRVVIDAITSAVKWFTALPGPVKIVITTIGAAAAAIFGLSGALSFLGISISSVLGPIGLIVGVISAVAAPLLIANNRTNDLVKTNKNLTEKTDTLKKSVENYKKINEELSSATETLNKTEKQTLENRQKLSKLELAANLEKTIKSILAVNEAYKKGGDSVEQYQANISELTKYQTANLKELERLKKLQSEGEIWDRGGYIKKYIEYTSAALKSNTKELQKNTTGLAKQQLLLEDSNKQRAESLEYLARAVSLGQLDLDQIKLYSEEIANQVRIRAQKIEQQEKEIEETEKLNDIQDDSIDNLDDLEKGNVKLTEATKKRLQALEEIGKSQIEILELERERAIEDTKNTAASKEAISAAIKAINTLYDAKIAKIKADEEEARAAEILKDKLTKENEELEKQKQLEIETAAAKESATRAAIASANEYRKKLEDLQTPQEELIDLERERAKAVIENSGATEEAQEKAIAAINEYYDLLKEEEANEIFEKNLEKTAEKTKAMWEDVVDKITSGLNYISEISSAVTDNRIDDIDRELQAELSSIDQRLQAALEAAGVAEQTTIERLQAELAAAIETGDQETISAAEDALERQQITERYERERAEATEEYERRKADIQYQGALAEWRLSLLTIAIDSALAIGKAIASAPWPLNIPAISFATAEGAAQAVVVALNEPQAPSFNTGGIMLPSGKSEGNLFRAAENGSSELLFNDSAAGAPFVEAFASKIAEKLNVPGQGINCTMIFYDHNKKEITREVVNLINNGVYQIEPRGIKK